MNFKFFFVFMGLIADLIELSRRPPIFEKFYKIYIVKCLQLL